MLAERISRRGLTPRHAVVALLVAGAVLLMLLSSGQMADLRVALPPLSQAMSWLEGLPVPLDMDHVAFFGGVAMAMRLLLPQLPWQRLLLVVAGLAAATELLQFASDGRTPRWQDARDDLIGGGIGLLVGALLSWLFSQRRLRHHARAASIGAMTPDAKQAAALHAVLAGWLVGREGCTPEQAIASHGVDAVLAACEREGVASLVHARLSGMGALHPVPPALLQALAARARLCAARSLLCMSEARKIQQALDAAGIPAIWLKGIALGQWLYPSMHLRDIADIDLLLPDHPTTLRAAQVLAPLGYVLPNPHIAGDLVVHELMAWSERAQLELDLHWDLSNSALFAGRLAWTHLQEGAISLPVLGEGARGLSHTDAFLHACLHRATNTLTGREDRLRWLYDIHLLALRCDADDWRHLLRTAQQARLADACVSALRACRRVFDTPVPDALMPAFEAAAAGEPIRTERLGRWAYFQRACWQRLPDFRTRLRWLRQLLFPDLSHLRVRYAADGAGHARILLRRLRDGFARWRGYTLGRAR